MRKCCAMLLALVVVACHDATAPAAWTGPCWLVKTFVLTARDGTVIDFTVTQPIGSATPYDPCPTNILPGWRREKP